MCDPGDALGILRSVRRRLAGVGPRRERETAILLASLSRGRGPAPLASSARRHRSRGALRRRASRRCVRPGHCGRDPTKGILAASSEHDGENTAGVAVTAPAHLHGPISLFDGLADTGEVAR